MWDRLGATTAIRWTRESVSERLGRVRDALPAIAQTTAAAGLAWLLAELVLPQDRPAFAPLTAIIALAATRGQRGGRAVQVALGVAVGVGLAGLVVRALGTGAWQLALVTALALGIAVFLSEGPVFVVQAGVSAALVVALGPTESVVGTRFTEALLGGAVALVFTQLLFPFDAERAVRSAVRSVLDDTAGLLGRGAAALRSSEPQRSRRAEAGLREVVGELADLEDALAEARSTLRLSRRRFGAGGLDRYEQGVELLARVIGDVGAVLRAGTRLADSADPAPGVLADAMDRLGETCRCAGAALAGEGEAPRDEAAAVAALAGRGAVADGRAVTVTTANLLTDASEALLRISGEEADAAAALVERSRDGSSPRAQAVHDDG